MGCKELTFTATLLLNMVICNSQEAYTAGALESFAEAPVAGQTTHLMAYSAPDVGSILSNPAIPKKQLSRHKVQAVHFREEQKVHFVVHFFKDQLHGPWQSFFGNSQICDSGSLKKGLPDGEWKTWYPNGQLKTIRNYSAEKYHYIQADVKRNHPKLQRYKLSRLAQQRQNIQPFFQPDYETTAYPTSAAGLLHIIHYNTDGDGSSYQPPFTRSLHHGLFVNFSGDGTIKDSGYYVNGLKHGIWKETSTDNETLSNGFYDNGFKSGQWKYYNAQGQLLYTDIYSRTGEKERHYFKK